MNVAIILASGSGKRMKAGKNKVFLPIGKKPIIYHTLKVFENSQFIDKIILVISEKDAQEFQRIIKKYKFKKIAGLVFGGAERQDSGYNGLKFVADKIENKKDLIVLFHNAANPFVSEEEIASSIKISQKFGASVVAHRTKDTIRKADKKNFSLGVIDRESLWNMQTPQTIKFPLALRAFEKAEEENFLGTDDVSLVERLGKRVKIIPASENNFKITTPLDLALARLIFKSKMK